MHDRLHNRVREARTSHGLTQAELATIAGLSRKTINTIENGVFIPATDVALRLALALKTKVEALFQLPTRNETRS